MAATVGFTFAIVTRNPHQTFVFCKYLPSVKEAIEYAEGEIAERGQYDVEYILIRRGVSNHTDPIVWDSRLISKTKSQMMSEIYQAAGIEVAEIISSSLSPADVLGFPVYNSAGTGKTYKPTKGIKIMQTYHCDTNVMDHLNCYVAEDGTFAIVADNSDKMKVSVKLNQDDARALRDQLNAMLGE